MTPLGEIHIYINGIFSDYEFIPHDCNNRSVCENPLDGCFRITVSGWGANNIRCVIACNNEVLIGSNSDERYLGMDFCKDNIIVTIGAEDENSAFDTNQLSHGIEYALKFPIDKVEFGVAWSVNYEGVFDIRTYLATDLF